MRNRAWISAMLLAGLLATGCESKSFKAEREMYLAQKMAKAVYKNPKGTPPFEVSSALRAFEEIVKKYPDSILEVEAQKGIGNLYLATGDFEQARQAYGRLIRDCDKKKDVCVQGALAVAKSYEAEDKWPQALAEYNKLLQDYPLSNMGLALPIYIINHYKRVKDENGVAESVRKAVAQYYGLMGRSSEEKVDYFLLGLVARSYMTGGRWQDALDTLEKIVRDYPKFQPEQAILAEAFIYKTYLKDPAKTKEMLQRIAKDYPQSPLAKQAEALLKKL